MTKNTRRELVDPRTKKFGRYSVVTTGKGNVDEEAAADEFGQIFNYLHKLTDQLGDTAVPFDQFFDVDRITNTAILNDAGREAIKRAELVIDHDSITHNDRLLFGFDKLRQIVRNNGGEWLSIVRVALAVKTKEFDYLLDAVSSIKGRLDWNKADGDE